MEETAQTRHNTASHPYGPDGHDGASADAFSYIRRGRTREESTALHDAWTTYDEDVAQEKYQGPAHAADTLAEAYPTDRGSLLILDVACGTGLVAEKLLPHGFSRLHGLDPSSRSLEIARRKNVYQDLFCCYLDSNPLPMEADTYDGAVICGAFGANMVPAEGLRQLARVVKPGGYVVLVTRQKYPSEDSKDRDQLELEKTAMEEEGIWRQISASVVSGYDMHTDALVWKYVIY